MKCHKEDAPLLGLMGQSMRLIGKRAQELYAEYDLNRAQSGMRLTLAQKGRDSIAYVIKTAEKLEEKVFEGMSAEEKMLFRRLLLQIIENVE